MADQKAALERWRKQIGNITMPVMSTDEAIEEMLSAGVGLARIRDLLDDDPPLALDIVLAAGRLPKAPDFVQSLHHAVNLMGLSRVQNFVRARSARRLDPLNSNTHRLFLDTVAVSRFAATLVSRWEEPRSPGSSAYLGCVTLLLNLARWKLSLADPRLAMQIDERALAGERRSVVEAELLGCSMDELNHAVLLDVGFPSDSPLVESLRLDNHMLIDAARCAWLQQLAPEIPAPIGRWLRLHMLPPMLAHLLAWSAHDGWHSRRTLLLHRVVSARENKPLDAVIADSHRSAAYAARSLGTLGAFIQSPAERLFHAPPLPRQLRERPAEQAQEKPTQPARKPVPEESASPPPRRRVENTDNETGTPPSGNDAKVPARPPADKGNPTRLQEFVTACRNKEFTNLRVLMTELGDALDKGIALKRSLIMLHPPKSETLRGFMNHGFDDDSGAASIEFSVASSALLSRLLDKGGNLHIDATQRSTVDVQLPTPLRKLALPSGHLLGSIKMNDRSVGLIWTDTGRDDIPTSARQFEAFRIVMNHFNAAFSHIAQSARKR